VKNPEHKMSENSIQVNDYFLGEPDRCERLISILQFCSHIAHFSDSKIISSEDLSSVSFIALTYIRLHIVTIYAIFDILYAQYFITFHFFYVVFGKGSLVSANDRYVWFIPFRADHHCIQ
jgi:hypothetical protein